MKTVGGWTWAGIVLTVFWVLAVLFELRIEIKQGPFGLLMQTGSAERMDPLARIYFGVGAASNYIKLGSFLFGMLVPILSLWIFWDGKTAGLLALPKGKAGLLPLR